MKDENIKQLLKLQQDDVGLTDKIIEFLLAKEMMIDDILHHQDDVAFHGLKIPPAVINKVAIAIEKAETAPKQAFLLYEFAATFNYPIASYNSALCILFGQNPSQDYDKALIYAEQAKKAAYKYADYLLGRVYMKRQEYLLASYAFSAVLPNSEKYQAARKNLREAIALGNLAHHGLTFTDDFSIFLGAKNPRKRCTIEYRRGNPPLSIHDRQSLAERVIDTAFTGGTSKKNWLKFVDGKPTTTVQLKLHDLGGGYTKKYTLLLINVGFVTTDRIHKKNGEHSRRFVTLPVRVENFTTFRGGATFTIAAVNSTHAESGAFAYLLDDDNLNNIIARCKDQHKLADGSKIYSVVLDMHSSLDMCTYCCRDAESFLQKFREKMLELLPQHNFVLPKNQPTLEGLWERQVPNRSIQVQKITLPAGTAGSAAAVIDDTSNFRVVINYSAQCDYREGIRKTNEQAPRLPTALVTDLRYSDRLLLFHSTNRWHGKWVLPGAHSPADAKKTFFEKWTAFCSESVPDDAKHAEFNVANSTLLDVEDVADAAVESKDKKPAEAPAQAASSAAAAPIAEATGKFDTVAKTPSASASGADEGAAATALTPNSR